MDFNLSTLQQPYNFRWTSVYADFLHYLVSRVFCTLFVPSYIVYATHSFPVACTRRSVEDGPVSLSRCSCCEVRSPSSWTSSSPTPHNINLCPSSAFSSQIDLCLGPLSSEGHEQSGGEGAWIKQNRCIQSGPEQSLCRRMMCSVVCFPQTALVSYKGRGSRRWPNTWRRGVTVASLPCIFKVRHFLRIFSFETTTFCWFLKKPIFTPLYTVYSGI